MRKKIILSTLIAASLLTVGCSDDYLVAEPSQRISADQVALAAENNPDVVAGTVRGLYALMYQSGTGGTTGDDDFGQKGIDIWTDMLSGDIAHQSTSYGWYRTFSALQNTVDPTANSNYQAWRYLYRLIRSSNQVIQSLGGNDNVPSNTTNKHYMGQAKAMRAYAYFYLTQLYADKYEPNKEILPLYDEPTSVAKGKAKTSDIFALIVKDLEESIDYLSDFNRQFKNEVNKDVAKALLAYAYGIMGEYGKTKTLTSEIINTGAYTLMSRNEITGGFNNINTPGWFWGADLTIEMGLSLDTWWSQMDYYTYGYQSSGNEKAIDVSLYNLIPANDARKNQFTSDLLPRNKFYDPARQWDGQRPVVTDYLFMRIAEIYLLNAEAAAKEGDEATAKNSLKHVLSERIPDVSYIDGLTGIDLENEIYLQTRIELWGEGKSYLALNRNKASVIRGSNHLHFVGESISYDDDRLSFEIPLSEIQNNVLINSQN